MLSLLFFRFWIAGRVVAARRGAGAGWGWVWGGVGAVVGRGWGLLGVAGRFQQTMVGMGVL